MPYATSHCICFVSLLRKLTIGVMLFVTKILHLPEVLYCCAADKSGLALIILKYDFL